MTLEFLFDETSAMWNLDWVPVRRFRYLVWIGICRTRKSCGQRILLQAQQKYILDTYPITKPRAIWHRWGNGTSENFSNYFSTAIQSKIPTSSSLVLSNPSSESSVDSFFALDLPVRFPAPLSGLSLVSHNWNKKQFIEFGLKSLVWIWVAFPLPTILISYNNTIISLRKMNDVNKEVKEQMALQARMDSAGASDGKIILNESQSIYDARNTYWRTCYWKRSIANTYTILERRKFR